MHYSRFKATHNSCVIQIVYVFMWSFHVSLNKPFIPRSFASVVFALQMRCTCACQMPGENCRWYSTFLQFSFLFLSPCCQENKLIEKFGIFALIWLPLSVCSPQYVVMNSEGDCATDQRQTCFLHHSLLLDGNNWLRTGILRGLKY